ncbi:MAG: hypothetical protein ACKVP0_09990 [Pirellulaceae bacterium]
MFSKTSKLGDEMVEHSYYDQLARDITDQLLREWQQEPFRWESEIDIQSELYGRLSADFQLVGKSIVSYSPSGKAARIAAEPTVYYEVADLGECRCKPDIVIRDDVVEKPTDGGHWPLIWVCELKFDPIYKADGPNPDIPKVRALIQQKKTKYGCCVRLSHRPAPVGEEITWKQDEQNQFHWICEVHVLPTPGTLAETHITLPPA